MASNYLSNAEFNWFVREGKEIIEWLIIAGDFSFFLMYTTNMKKIFFFKLSYVYKMSINTQIRMLTKTNCYAIYLE